MWQSLQNLLKNIRAYPELSPDMGLRYRVKRWLRSRPDLTVEQWYLQCWQSPQGGFSVSKRLIQFLHTHLEKHTGLDAGRIRPSDRLIEDLKFPLICWFDWPIALCDDVYTEFNVDIVDRFDESQLSTVEELARFLDAEIAAADSIPS
ncbi:MAG: hypothetical protein AAFW84_11940 [Cyanobacteria bacterium J06635_15]